jgi:hypothetical protein
MNALWAIPVISNESLDDLQEYRIGQLGQRARTFDAFFNRTRMVNVGRSSRTSLQGFSDDSTHIVI